MRHAEAFDQSLAVANSFVFTRAVRRYQQEILDHGHFRVVCPRTGRRLAPTVCHVADSSGPAYGDISIAYRVPCEPAIWLLAGSVKDGFPLSEAYQPSGDTSLWSLGETHAEQNRPWKTLLQALEADLDAAPLPAVSPGKSALLLGHPNFAHNLWNELPAVDAYTRSRQGPEDGGILRVTAVYEPLLPVEDFSGGVAMDVTRLDRFDHLAGFQAVMTTRLGATQIPADLRNKVTRLLHERRDPQLTDPALTALRACQPVVWLSARLDARTADNQEELLWRLVTVMATVFPRVGFVLDGFSYPNDFHRAIYRQPSGRGSLRLLRKLVRKGVLSTAIRARARRVGAWTCSLERRLGGRIANPIVNVTGMSLANAISVASSADYYVCHGGSLQHKIAWLHNIPGSVHCNTASLQPGVATWLADQLEGGVRPGLVSTRWIEDLESIRTVRQVERNRDYHIADVEGAVDEIVGALQASMAAPPPA